MIYTVTLNPAVDYVLELPELRSGEVNRARKQWSQIGGKGINVSVMLHNLDVESVATGFLAGFTGDSIEQGLVEKGIRTGFVHMATGLTRINVKLKNGAETDINAPGPDIGSSELGQLYEKLDRLRTGDVLVLAGSAPECLPHSIYADILERLKERRILAVVDAARDLLADTLAHYPFLIKPNHTELEEFFGRELRSSGEICTCARQLQERGARNVLVSMAGSGAILVDEDRVCHTIGAPCGGAVNSVGAGDAMVAGFLAGYLESGDYRRALLLGVAAGSATAFSRGMASREKVYDLLRGME